MKRIKLTLKEASEWAAEGYEIECYAVVEPVKHSSKPNGKSKTQINPRMADNTILAISVEGTPPKQGKVLNYWEHIKDKVYKDIKQKQTREAIIAAIQKHFSCERADAVAAISSLVHHHKVLRIYNEV